MQDALSVKLPADLVHSVPRTAARVAKASKAGFLVIAIREWGFSWRVLHLCVKGGKKPKEAFHEFLLKRSCACRQEKF